jgi:type IV pilus assembly protein PilW
MVELMVAITLALIVTTGVLSVFVGSRSAFQSTSGIAALSDGGRFALNSIENSVRDSGFMACSSVNTLVSNLNPAAMLGYAVGPSGLLQPLTGYEAKNTSVGNTYAAGTTLGAVGNWNPNLDAAFGGLAGQPNNLGMYIKNNDILVTRSAAPSSQPSYVLSIADGSNNFTVDSQGSLQAPQWAVISDCGMAVLFEITSLGPAAPGIQVNHIVTTPGNAVAALPPATFGAGAMVMPLTTTVYYIGVGDDGDGALFSASVAPNNTLTTNELVPDVEAMQILYGVDTTGLQTVTQYVTADQVVDFTAVMSVQVAILAAGPPGSANTPAAARTYSLFGTLVTAPIDSRARQVFEVTIAARNALP